MKKISFVKEALMTTKQAPLMSFEEAKEIMKIIVSLFLLMSGLWYAHFKSLELVKFNNFNVVISTFLFGPVLQGLICFFLYGLLVTDRTNRKILKGLSKASFITFREWPIFLLYALILAVAEKIDPIASARSHKLLIIILIALTSAVIFAVGAAILRVILYSKAITAQVSFLKELLFIGMYFLVFGVVMVLLFPIVPKI